MIPGCLQHTFSLPSGVARVGGHAGFFFFGFLVVVGASVVVVGFGVVVGALVVVGFGVVVGASVVVGLGVVVGASVVVGFGVVVGFSVVVGGSVVVVGLGVWVGECRSVEFRC